MSWIDRIRRRLSPGSLRTSVADVLADQGTKQTEAPAVQNTLAREPSADPMVPRSSLQFLRSVLASEVQEEQAVELSNSLWLSRTRLRWLPGNLAVQGDLLLECCQRFRGFLGRSLQVGGSLRIGGPAHPAWLGDDRELVEAYGGRVSEFLQRPSVESTCPLELLPDETRVAGDICLVNCSELQTLPSILRLRGSATFINCGIQSLPSDLTIHGDLAIDGCPLEFLPEGLQVSGNLTLANLSLETLPYHLNVGGDLRLRNCRKLSQIPGSISIGGSLRVVGADQLERVSPQVKIGKGLQFKRCATERIDLPRCSSLSIIDCPNLRTVESSYALTMEQLRVDRCVSLESIPNGLTTVKSCILTNLPQLKSLPRYFESLCTIEIDGTTISDLTEKQTKELSFRIQGVPIPGHVLFHPARITLDEVLRQENVEVRRVYMEQMGIECFESRVRHVAVAKDVDAGGERMLVRYQPQFGPERHYLFCRCPSTARTYLLQVPPRFDSCHAAAAWLAGFENPDDYQPIVET